MPCQLRPTVSGVRQGLAAVRHDRRCACACRPGGRAEAALPVDSARASREVTCWERCPCKGGFSVIEFHWMSQPAQSSSSFRSLETTPVEVPATGGQSRQRNGGIGVRSMRRSAEKGRGGPIRLSVDTVIKGRTRVPALVTSLDSWPMIGDLRLRGSIMAGLVATGRFVDPKTTLSVGHTSPWHTFRRQATFTSPPYGRRIGPPRDSTSARVVPNPYARGG